MNINDVAKAAGVSRGSVSNYLNKKKVSEKTSQKIEEAIKALNYVPNSSARDLRSKDSKFVIFIIPTVWTPFFAELTYYIQTELNNFGYKMILCISDSNFEKEKEYIELAKSQKAAGIISISYSQMNDFVSPGMPLVSIEKEPTGKFPLVSSDNYSGGKLAAQKLKDAGSEKLIYIGEKTIYSDAMLARKSGFVDFCASNHVDYQVFGVTSIRQIDVVRKELLHLLKEVTVANTDRKLGIFTITDEYGYLILQLLNEMNISVPGQIKIIGFDGSRKNRNEEAILSSIRQPVELIAKNSVKLLINSMNNKLSDVERLYLPISFYQGKTT